RRQAEIPPRVRPPSDACAKSRMIPTIASFVPVLRARRKRRVLHLNRVFKRTIQPGDRRTAGVTRSPNDREALVLVRMHLHRVGGGTYMRPFQKRFNRTGRRAIPYAEQVVVGKRSRDECVLPSRVPSRPLPDNGGKLAGLERDLLTSAGRPAHREFVQPRAQRTGIRRIKAAVEPRLSEDIDRIAELRVQAEDQPRVDEISRGENEI